MKVVSFPADILPSLIIVKEPGGVSQTYSVKKLFLEICRNSQKNTCVRVSFLIKLFIKKETLAKLKTLKAVLILCCETIWNN